MRFLLNKLTHTLTLKGGYLKIEAGCTNTNPLSDDDFNDPTVIDAQSRGWAERVAKAVLSTGTVNKPAITVADSKGGLTEAELKAQLASKVEKPAATTTKLGENDGIPQGGAEGTKLGEPEAAPAVEAPAEAKPAAKSGKKTA